MHQTHSKIDRKIKNKGRGGEAAWRPGEEADERDSQSSWARVPHPPLPRWCTGGQGPGLRGGGRGAGGAHAALGLGRPDRLPGRPTAAARGTGRPAVCGPREGRPERPGRETGTGSSVPPYSHSSSSSPPVPPLSSDTRRSTSPADMAAPAHNLKTAINSPLQPLPQIRCPGARDRREPRGERTKKPRDSNPGKAVAKVAKAAKMKIPAPARLRTRSGT